MEKSSALLYAVIIAACVIAGVTAVVMSTYPEMTSHEGHMGENMRRTSSDVFKNVLTALDIVLLGALIFIYVSILRQMRSRLAFGMLIFSMAMLAQVLTSNPEIHHIWAFTGTGLGPFEYLPDMFVTVALAVLAYISLE